MRRIRAALVTVIILALAVHIVWMAIAPSLPYVIGVLLVTTLLGSFLHRRRRW